MWDSFEKNWRQFKLSSRILSWKQKIQWCVLISLRGWRRIPELFVNRKLTYFQFYLSNSMSEQKDIYGPFVALHASVVSRLARSRQPFFRTKTASAAIRNSVKDVRKFCQHHWEDEIKAVNLLSTQHMNSERYTARITIQPWSSTCYFRASRKLPYGLSSQQADANPLTASFSKTWKTRETRVGLKFNAFSKPQMREERKMVNSSLVRNWITKTNKWIIWMTIRTNLKEMWSFWKWSTACQRSRLLTFRLQQKMHDDNLIWCNQKEKLN